MDSPDREDGLTQPTPGAPGSGSRRSPIPADGACPTFLGRYRILGELGRGGMGIVFLGIDPDLEREVAIKVLPPHLGDHPDFFARFQREARLLAALHHPNVAIIHSLEVIDDVPLLTMERIHGRTLAARLTEGALPPEEILHVGTRIARAIEAAHDRDVIHRDLKPGNVMLGDDGQIKVLDFGLAKVVSHSRRALSSSDQNPATTATVVARFDAEEPSSEDVTALLGNDDGEGRRDGDGGTSLSGTPGYMSPEQIRGEPIDRRTDVFSFGCILYECATGTRAFFGESTGDRIRATLEAEAPFERFPAELSEGVRQVLTRCLAKDPGDRPDSMREIRRALEDDLERSRFRRRAASLPSVELTVSGEIPNNLPHALSSFVGRTEESRAVLALLAAHRLVALAGAGGAGKTRLAIEVARTVVQQRGASGVWIVELAPLTEPALLEKTVMTALGVPEQPSQTPLESILEGLGSSALLVLDNCEHLGTAVPSFVRSVLQRGRDLRILVTSREPLGLEEEHRFLVPPLSGRLAEEAPLASLLESDAVRLFVERARQVRPDFALTEANGAAVVGICRRLDGLPLALELAASRVRVLEPEMLLARLDDRFRVLSGGARDKVPHHRTLAASVEWSHEQLDAEEQTLFRRLGVFVGGFRLEAIEAVCVDASLEAWRVLDVLTSLIDKSLVELDFQRPDAERLAPRYRMLETFREYGSARLQEAGEGPRFRAALVRHYTTFVVETAERLNGPEAKSLLSLLDLEYANIREVIRVALTEVQDPGPALSITSSLTRYWLRRSHSSEGLDFLSRALQRPGAEERFEGRALGLNAAGTLEYLRGRYVEAIDHLTEAAVLFEEAGNATKAAHAHMGLGNTFAFLARWEEAIREHEVVLSLGRAERHDWLTAAALVNLCNVHEALGNLDAVVAAATEAVVVLGRLGDRPNLIMAQNYLAAVAYRREEYAEALAIYERGRVMAEEHGDPYAVGFQRLHTGLCRTALRDFAAALADQWAALLVADEFEEPNLLATTIEGLAHWMSICEMHEEAVRTFALAARVREERAAPLRDSNRAGLEGSLSALADRFGADRFADLTAEGRRTTVAEFIAGGRPAV